MITVHKCQAIVAAGSWRNPRVKLMPVIVASISIARLYVRAVQNVMPPLVGFHHGGPDDDDERDKQKRFDDHVFNPFRHTIHRGSTGHSGQKSGLQPEAKSLRSDATFLQRLLVGWTRPRGAKLVPFSERIGRRRTLKGYFSATTLLLVAFD
jgi:hypothetical protein